MEIIQAAVKQMETVESRSLIVELKPFLQSAFLDILNLFICKLEEAVDIEKVKEFLKNSNQSLLRAKEVSDHHFAVAQALRESYVSQLIDVFSDLRMKERALKEHEENESLENETFIKTIENVRSDLGLEMYFYAATLNLYKPEIENRGIIRSPPLHLEDFFSAVLNPLPTSPKTVKDLDSNQSCIQEILELSKETIVTLQDQLDRLLILSKKIQEDKENTAREFVTLNEKTDELSVKRAWLIKMVEEIEKISYCVNRISVLISWAYDGCTHWLHYTAEDLSDIIRRLVETIFADYNLPWYLALVDRQTIEEIYKVSVRLKENL